jgi:hypothetical protein
MSIQTLFSKKCSLFFFVGLVLTSFISANNLNLRLNKRSLISIAGSRSDKTETALILKEQQIFRYCLNNPNFNQSKHECLVKNVIGQCMCWTDCTKINGLGKCVDWISCRTHNVLGHCLD